MSSKTLTEWAVDALAIFTTPSCWLQNYPYSNEWDEELTFLLDSGAAIALSSSGYQAEIDGYTVWVGNHPYASFTINDGAMTVRPRRATIIRAGRMLGPVRRHVAGSLIKQRIAEREREGVRHGDL